MPPLSIKAFAKLAQEMAGASDEAILAAAKQITDESYEAAARGVRSVRDILESGEDFGVLSAANPGRKLPTEENLARHEILRGRLRELGYDSPLEQRGVYGSEPEPSFLVPGLTSDLAKQLGREFEQEAVISARGWHRLADDAEFPRTGLTYDQTTEDYFSELTDPATGQPLKYQFAFPDEAFGPPPTSPAALVSEGPTSAPNANLRASADELTSAGIEGSSPSYGSTLSANEQLRRESEMELAHRYPGLQQKMSAAAGGPAPLRETTQDPLVGTLPDAPRASALPGGPEFQQLEQAAPAIVRLDSKVVKGLGTLAKALRKTDVPGVYELHPKIRDRVLQLTEIGMRLPQRANWKGVNDPEFLEGGFGGNAEAAKLWGQFFGATSPGTSVPVNIRESLAALRFALTHPDEELTVSQVKRFNPPITMAPSKVPNLNRIIRGEKMSTPKPDRLGRLQTGEQRVVPWDVHALEGIGSERETFQQEISDLRTMMTKAEGLPRRGGITNEQIYERAEQALLTTLDELQPGLATDPAFAVFWEGVRAHKGLTYQGGPIDVLRKKGLLKDAGMLDPGRLKKVLKSAGWTAGAITAVLKATSAEAGERKYGPPTTPGDVPVESKRNPRPGIREWAKGNSREGDITLPGESSKAKTAAPMNARVARPKNAA
jgi:hypothetical protein